MRWGSEIYTIAEVLFIRKQKQLLVFVIETNINITTSSYVMVSLLLCPLVMLETFRLFAKQVTSYGILFSATLEPGQPTKKVIDHDYVGR